ncbi:MAG TPA: flavin reductase family protein [Longimicrobiaceae bacterium]|jgi:flavin reductase (NADH)|nr:flavin reductase family protein [Longimicrobiaceae bacterium]
MSASPIRPSIRTHVDAPAADAEAVRQRFRDALALWASGVAVLAVSDGEDIDAITVSAFTVVSLDPPLVLVCVSENSSLIPMLLEERRFVVSVLAEGDQRVASRVANRLPPESPGFAGEGVPVLQGALAAFVCRLHAAYPGGDHRIVVGEVERVERGRDSPPLLYFNRSYRRLCGPPPT